MPKGWIRAYAEEIAAVGQWDENEADRNARARFRADFKTTLHKDASTASQELRQLMWGDNVDLPDGLSTGLMTRAVVDGTQGFIPTAHVVEIAYVKKRSGTSDDRFKTTLAFKRNGEEQKIELIWGDCVQIIEKGSPTKARARGVIGTVESDHLGAESLLEVFFIDVGQGDGVLVCTPDGRHLLIDGGLERTKQLTGKNAADFVDWKYFVDYGHHRIRLDSMMASHSDNDHYGGLHDLVRLTPAADRELDCLGTDIVALHHPGLSRWENRPQANPPHSDGLGPKVGHFFTRLLGDRADAEAAVKNNATDELSTYWKWFFRDVLANGASATIERVGVRRESLQAGDPLPHLWSAAAGCSIRVLGPVSVDGPNGPQLKDLGEKSINTNGHSICLRIDFGKARILLTGDLNKESMDWLDESYGQRMDEFACDVAKACHHGSHKISFKFLKKMGPAATIISSGDAEGHAHPRPEVVGASAIAGHVTIDANKDVLVTPLVYMTEIERSVSLGAVNRVKFKHLPLVGSQTPVDGFLPGRHLDELSAEKRLAPSDEAEIAVAPAADQQARRTALLDHWKDLEEKAIDDTIQATYYYTVPQGPLAANH